MSRLIDADALIDGYKHMRYDPSEHPEESYIEGWCKGFNSAVDHCTHHVIHAPTIEPERKTGKCEPVVVFDGYVDFCCSACHGYRFHCGEMRKKYKYCPNCGTKMEGTE